MPQMIAVDFSRVLLARLTPGESVMAGFRGILDDQRIQRAVILSGIGSVVKAQFLGVRPHAHRPFGTKWITQLEAEGPFEILTIEGNVFPSARSQVVHLHVTLGTSDGKVIGGHLVDGEVYTTVELFLAVLDCCRVRKVKDPLAGGIQLNIPTPGPGVTALRHRKPGGSRSR